MLQKTIIFTLALFLAGCGEKKPNTLDTEHAINLEAIAKSEKVYESLEQDILALIKSDGMISVQTGKAFTQLNLKKGESNGNIPVVYLEEDIKGDVAQFIKQFSTDLFVLGYSVAGLLDQASRNSPDPIQTYVDSVASLAELDEDKHEMNPNWLTLNKVLYIENNADQLKKADQGFSVEMCLKMLGYAYFQSGILAYLYGYIGYHGLESDKDLEQFKKEQVYTHIYYFPYKTHVKRPEEYSYVVDLRVNPNAGVKPKADSQNNPMNIEHAKKLSKKIINLHTLGEYTHKLIEKLENKELSIDKIPGLFKDSINNRKLVALCIPTPDSLQGKLSNQAIQIVKDIRAGLETRIQDIAQQAQNKEKVQSTVPITSTSATITAPATNSVPATVVVQTTNTAPASTK